MVRLPALPLLLALFATILPRSAGAGPFEILRSSDSGLELELRLPSQIIESGPDGGFLDFRAPGFARVDEPGKPALPFAAALLAVPEGAVVEVVILASDAVDLGRVRLPAAPSKEDGGDVSPGAIAPTQAGPFVPDQVAVTEYVGILRGVAAHSLRVYPLSYDGARLTALRQLRIRVRFRDSQVRTDRAKAATTPPTVAERALYEPFLNAAQAPAMSRVSSVPAAKTAAAAEWYDPARPWVKLFVGDDGVYCVTREWLESRQVDADAVDPATLRLFYLGEEQPLFVSGEEGDGRFDPGDYLLFHGRFRRDEVDGREKDFDSLYGRRNTYWLTWGGEPGRRFATRSAAPINDYPESDWFAATAHFEQDLWYQSLQDAPDNDLDHWFWKRTPVKSVSPTLRGSNTFFGDLFAPDLQDDYTTRVRVALNGFSSLQHHTFLELNGNEIDESRWTGQGEFVVEREIPSSFLASRRNRVLVQTLADSTKFDLVFFNWFEIDYRRRYEAGPGYLAFDKPATDGRRTTLTGLSHPQVELFDVANALRFVDMAVSSIGETWQVTFEDRSDIPSAYAIADSLSIAEPLGLVDASSELRSPANAADYVIIYHPRFAEAARSLADHRAAVSGLAVKLVATDDIYDEFSFGRFTNRAVQDFIAHAYHNWQGRPAYVLLLGDETFDYRMILRGPPPSFVPSLYYQARKRGNSPSDYLYTLVDGDDLLADLAIGRLAVTSSDEADGAVEKIIRYDLDLEPGDWRSRVIYLANWDETDEFIRPNNALAARFTEPYGLASVKIANPDESPLPNETGRKFVDALNEGALLVNYAGHGSAGNMQFVFALQFPDWGYLGQVANDRRLPLVLALSCLNGMFVDPTAECLGQVFTSKPDGGAIAYISASALSFIAQNDLLAENIYEQFFEEGQLAFGPVLNAAKARVLAAHSSFVDAALTMQLFGDPAQELALPTAADYEPVRLEVTSPQVLSHTEARVEVTVRNNTRLTADSLTVVVLGRSDLGSATPDTLFARRQGPFVGSRTLSFDWPVGDRAGSYTLELLLDPNDRIPESDELNNTVQLGLQILEPLLPIPVFPASGSVLPAEEVSLEVLAPFSVNGEEARFACEFALSAAPEFDQETTLLSAPVSAESGRSVFRPESLPAADAVFADTQSPATPLFWRSRLLDGGNPGPWTETLTFRALSEPSDPDPADTGVWRQAGIQLLGGDTEELEQDDDGGLRVSTASLPFRPSSQTREAGFTVRGLEGAGVLATDGTYLYAKRWFNDDSTVYPGSDFFMRIGTGFNGTIQDLFYGFLADSTTAGISATYHSDGFIYSESGRGFELERIWPASGKLDTVAVPDGLLEWKLGRVDSLGHALITSDGRYIYNVSMSSPVGTRTGWGVRVFDPADGWRLVREFVSPPTETGFTFMWTDGIIADGERLYFIEYGDRRRIRMVDAADGRFLDEWTSDQDTTRIIGGQYDWINNKVWLGDLMGSAIFRYTGLGGFESGSVVSEPVGPALAWQSLSVKGDESGSLRIAIEVEGPAGRWQTLTGFDDLVAGLPPVDLSGIDATSHPAIRLRADLADTTGTARLDAWEVRFQPQALLEVSDADALMDSSGLRVRVAVRNLSPFTVTAAELILEQTDGVALSRLHLAALERGESRVVAVDSLALPPSGVGLFARLLTPEGPVGDRLEIPLLFEGRAPLTFSLWPADHTFSSGDPLRPGQGIVISAPPVEAGRLVLAVDGEAVEPDSLLDGGPEDRLRVIFRPQMQQGRHRLSVRLFSGPQEIGSQEIVFALTEALALGHVLLYPHPVMERSDFTYALSHDAEVSVEIFSMGGRLVRALGPLTQAAGFGRIEWDGRDGGGQSLANGTYFYRLRAVGVEGDGAEARGPLIVLR